MLCGMAKRHPFLLFIFIKALPDPVPHLIHLLDTVLKKVIMHNIGDQQNKEHNAQKDCCRRGSHHDHKHSHYLQNGEKDSDDQVDQPFVLEV